MLGAIIGDIVGSRFEFANHLDTDFELFAKDCSFTDDTICTVAIADAFLTGKSYKESLLKWCRKYPNPKGGYGGSFARWIHSDEPQPYNSFGNGSAMRVSPCAWWSDSITEIYTNAQQSAKCTHDHHEGIKGALAVADCIYHSRFTPSKEDLKEMITGVFGYDLDMTCESIRKTNSFNESCQVTVPQAIVCFLESTDFESAIRLAVSIGGDSDTIAAITGSIAEAYYGIPDWIIEKAYEYLPPEFIEVIRQFNERRNE